MSVKTLGILAAGTLIAICLGALAHLQDRRRVALLNADPETVLLDPALARTAIDLGAPAYQRLCARCHGTRAGGDPSSGAPALADDEHLYGGRPEEIEQIVLYGIRAGTSRGKNLASMPAYARSQPYAREPIPPLSPPEIADVTQFVLSLSHRATDRDAAERGRALYQSKGGCYDCHGADGRGDTAIGAPNLGDAIWLYGGSPRSIEDSISYGRGGICPAFSHRITALEARAISLYVASLEPRARGAGADLGQNR
jgi:cbb3-type cytochrome c oxidase subunit III